jgi:hypothetical protein
MEYYLLSEFEGGWLLKGCSEPYLGSLRPRKRSEIIQMCILLKKCTIDEFHAHRDINPLENAPVRFLKLGYYYSAFLIPEHAKTNESKRKIMLRYLVSQSSK